MTNFFIKFKKTLFFDLFFVHFPNLGGKIFFSKKMGCHTQLHKGFYHHAKIQRNLMIQFQENTYTDVIPEGWTDPIS